MTELARVACLRCCQHLAVERAGVLSIGSQSFECVVRLRCRICAHETTWLPPRARSVLEVKVEQPEKPTIWHREAA